MSDKQPHEMRPECREAFRDIFREVADMKAALSQETIERIKDVGAVDKKQDRLDARVAIYAAIGSTVGAAIVSSAVYVLFSYLKAR